MPKVTLTINGGENYESNYPMITIGRTSDNNVSIPDDSNISRYHARIEQREDGFWFIDQGSSNGSSVNGTPVESEILLESGDTILLGGTSEIVFETDEVKEEEEDEDQTGSGSSESIRESENSEKSNAKSSSSMMLLAGTVVGVALISVAVAGYVFLNSGSKCEATAQIVKPTNGTFIKKSTDIEIEVTNPQCVQEVIYLINDQEVARSNSEPFSVSLNPEKHGDLADGRDRVLTVVLIDGKGEKIVQSNGVLLAFETLATPTPTLTPTPTITPTRTPKPGPVGKNVSPIETKEMGEKLLTRLLGGIRHRFEPQFWVEVNKRLPEFVSEGYYARAAKYAELINVSYVYELNVDAQVGFILAMSRSKFNPTKQGAEEGLWRMSNEFASNNSLNVMCGTETIGDPSQNCATKSSALYLKSVYLDTFDRDMIYSVAAFGMSPQEAAAWKASLPADRRDFGKIITSQKQLEEIYRFIAAGIVSENPQRFGLKNDRPLSDHYKITFR